MRSPRASQAKAPVRNVRNVVLGDILFKTWYPSFYPEALVGKDLETLYVCKSCFAYSSSVSAYLTHNKQCPLSGSPPGRQIYSKSGMSIWEIDGEEDKLFAQNLSLFAKLFLDNKSVFFDVVGFHYYLLSATIPPIGSTGDPSSHPSGPKTSTLPIAAQSKEGAAQTREQIVGFFSKEKLSWDMNNLACILVFPPWQRRGLGQVLMGASYALSRHEHRIGGPEKPLSELGRRSYLAFWTARVASAILDEGESNSRGKTKSPTFIWTVAQLADRCAMVPDDVIIALREMGVAEKKRDGDIVVNQQKVKDWVTRTRARLTPAVDEDAFILENKFNGATHNEDDGHREPE